MRKRKPQPAPARRSQREGASIARTGINGLLGRYFTHHLQTLISTLGQLLRSPFSLFMTTAVIGIALALPTGLHVVLTKAQYLSGELEGTAQISLFLKNAVNEQQAQGLAQKLRQMPEISQVRFISRQQALAEFKQNSGFAEAMQALDDNPLPHLLVVQPVLAQGNSERIQTLVQQLGQHIEVDVAQLDMDWIERLYSILDFLQRGAWLLAMILAMAVLLIVGNTIRLAIENRRDEIIIIKLIGGTNGFIRRPFLYTGFWYGLFGALIAFVIISTTLLLLSAPLEQLSLLYNKSLVLTVLDLETTFYLLLVGVLLGLVGSWLAVGRHLKDIEPV